MKNNIFLNPFAIINEKKLLLFGVLMYAIGLYIAFAMQVNVQVLRIDPLITIKFENVIINHCLIVIFLTLGFFGLGKIINKKTRFIDILTTVFIAMIPLYLSLFQNINGYLAKETAQIMNALKEGNLEKFTPSIGVLATTIIGLLLFIYYIYLLFVGFKTATNAKKIWQYVAFFVVLIVIDLIVSFLINSI